MRDLECSFSETKDATLVYINLKMPTFGKREVIMVSYKKPEYWVRTMMASRNGISLTGKATIRRKSGRTVALDASKIFLTAVSETSAADLGSCEN